MKKVMLVAIILGCVLIVQALAVPSVLNIQGRLTRRDGAPVTAATTADIYLYNALTGGTSLWVTDAIDIVPDSNGVFNAYLAGTTGNPLPEFLADNYYMEIVIEGDSGPLSPRQRLVAVPFAITARNVRYSETIGVYGKGTTAGGSFESTSGWGVFSRVQSGTGGAVFGRYGAQVYDLPLNLGSLASDKYGVYGASQNEIGVYGWGGKAGGSFESTAGPGVWAKSAGLYGVYGETATSGVPALFGVAGVTGRNKNIGYGVAGISDLGAGVLGSGLLVGVSGMSTNGVGVYGKGGIAGGSFESTSGYGIYGIGDIAKGGVVGRTTNAPALTDSNFGVAGASNTGSGVYGSSNSTDYWKAGVYGVNNSGKAVMGWSSSGIGLFGESVSNSAIFGKTTSSINSLPAIKGESLYGHATYGPAGLGAGVFGENAAAAGGGPGVRGKSLSGYGVRGESSASGISKMAGVYGYNNGATNGGPGVQGASVSGIGVVGISGGDNGVYAETSSSTKAGLFAKNTTSGPAIEIDNGTIKVIATDYIFTAWPGAGTTGLNLGGSLGRVDVSADRTKDINTELLYAKSGRVFYPRPSGFSTSYALIFIKNNLITANSQVYISSVIDDCRVVKVDTANSQIVVLLTGRVPAAHTGCTQGRFDFMVVN
jgi:hypothetical protein